MIPWTGACWAPLSIGFLRQEYRTGLPLPASGCLPTSGTEAASPELAGGFSPVEPPGEAHENIQSLNVSHYYHLTLQVHNDLLSSLNLYVGFSCVTCHTDIYLCHDWIIDLLRALTVLCISYPQ